MIKVVRNRAGNCVNFIGTTNPAYWNACLSAQVDTEDNTRINVINDLRTQDVNEPVYEFYKIPYTEFQDRDGNSFASATEAAAYISVEANVASSTGQFVLSDSDTMDFSLDATETTILMDNGDSFAINSIRAVASDDGHIDILQHTGDIRIFEGLRVANASINGNVVTPNQTDAVNQLNALFQHTGGSTGTAPTITSATTVNLTTGDTLNYELVATNGVAYEWSNLPSGVATVDGNVRKLIGGSSLAPGTYNISVKAINYFGEATATISLVVADPPYSNTKSVRFFNGDYLGANAALMDATLGRSGNGSGSSEAWTISLWFKGGTDTAGQTILYFGSNDTTNGGHIDVRFVGGTDKLRFQYGSSNNYLRFLTANDTLPANTWKHLLITYNGGTTGASSGSISSYYNRFKFFIDGTQVSTTDSHGNYGWSGSVIGDNFRIGRLSSGNYMKTCFVDELAIWGSDQSANVADIYNSGSTHDLAALTTAPDHYWRMGDGDTYSTIQDTIGTAHFVMYNMTAADIVNDVP